MCFEFIYLIINMNILPKKKQKKHTFIFDNQKKWNYNYGVSTKQNNFQALKSSGDWLNNASECLTLLNCVLKNGLDGNFCYVYFTTLKKSFKSVLCNNTENLWRFHAQNFMYTII